MLIAGQDGPDRRLEENSDVMSVRLNLNHGLRLLAS
jgi:hypothetical protein